MSCKVLDDVTSDGRCSTFLLRLPGKLGHQSYRAVLMVLPVLRSKMNAGVDDQGFEQRAVYRVSAR